MTSRAPIIYLPHGGGPLPLLGDPGHATLVDCLRNNSAILDDVKAMVLVSAHWETRVVQIANGNHPELIYDYYGFPPESYEIQYPAPGEADVARTVHQLLDKADISSVLDPQRGFDHGVFVPLKLLRPQADIPIVPVSLMEGLDPGKHLALGSALADLPAKGIAIIGSGLSFHNMQAFFGAAPDVRQKAAEFDQWLQNTCCDAGIDSAQRSQRLTNWEQAPQARFCHPREEHLLPLHVCAGAAQLKPASVLFSGDVLGMPVSGLLWQ